MTTTAPSQTFTPEQRRKYLGASEIAAILGLDKWQTALDVYNSKLGLVSPFEGNQHTLRGQRLEAIAADYYCELTGRKLRRYTKAYAHKQYPFIAGHIDRIVEGESVIAEIKCPSFGAYRKIQREGLPDGWQIQMQVYMGLSSHKKCVIIVFCADAFDLLHFELEFDEAIFSPAIAAAADFWIKHVITEIPPDLEKTKKPEFELPKTDGSVTFRDDEMFIARAQTLREAIQLKRDGEELYELAKKDLLESIENLHGCYEGGGVRFYYSQREGRKTLDKKRLAAEHPELSLVDYEKTGNPYDEFRPYLINS
jgi:putative phage-type endonuclease